MAWWTLVTIIGFIDRMQDAVAPLAPSTPLAASTAMNAQWHWTTHIRLPSIGFNRLSVRKTCYPPLTSPTHLKAYTDASFVQLRAVISMDKKQIAFYSPKLKEMQMRSTTTERATCDCRHNQAVPQYTNRSAKHHLHRAKEASSFTSTAWYDGDWLSKSLDQNSSLLKVNMTVCQIL